jgi:hypothetical protein
MISDLRCNAPILRLRRLFAQRRRRFGVRRSRSSNGFGRLAPMIAAFGSSPAIVRRCALNSSRRIAAKRSRLIGRVIGHRLSA